MLWKVFLALCLMAVCVIIHASGASVALRRLRRQTLSTEFWPSTWMYIRLAAWMILCHLVEIAIWALAYLWGGAMPDLPSAAYFSTVTYTTTGYGDLTLPEEWRLVGGVEALTGILMCGWFTGFFFAVVSRMHSAADAEDLGQRNANTA
jgi:hypothetical protein